MAQRIDKWLVYARIVKHRAKAQALIEEGQVRLNRERVTKVSHVIKYNDILTVAVAGHVKVIRVLAEAERRGPPSSVANLYEVLSGLHDSLTQKQDADPAALC